MKSGVEKQEIGIKPMEDGGWARDEGATENMTDRFENRETGVKFATGHK